MRNQVLFVFLVLAYDRRRVLHFNVTAQPTAEWTGQQIVEAFPWVDPPRYLLRDRDSIYGTGFRKRVGNLGFEEVFIAPRSPWQNPYVEKLIGTMRRECLEPREVQSAEQGRVAEVAEVGGLHHHYERIAA